MTTKQTFSQVVKSLTKPDTIRNVVDGGADWGFLVHSLTDGPHKARVHLGTLAEVHSVLFLHSVKLALLFKMSGC
jgi:hypothetical protein